MADGEPKTGGPQHPREDRDADDRLVDWAQAVADGRAIDWGQLRSTAPDLASSIAALRLVETVIAAHRAPVGRSGEAAPPPGPERAADAAGPPAFPPLGPDAAWGPLRLLQQIGAGTFGDVYRAFDPALELEVAVKILRRSTRDPEVAERYFDEARRLARVRHPNVLRVYGAASHDGTVGIWSELIQGRTLEECIAADGPFGPREAAGIGIDLCSGLAAVHGAGLLHRDLKTQNVMRERGGRVVLMDFGSVSDVAGSPARREAGYGTPISVAPELLRGEPATAATDVYALGVLLYRLMTGRYPIEASTIVELLDRQHRGEWTPLREVRPDLPAALVEAVERALEPDPKRRHRGPAALERALRAAVGATDGRHVDGRLRLAGLPLWLRIAGFGLAALLLLGIGLTVGQYVEHFWAHDPEGVRPHEGAASPAGNAAVDLTATARLYRQRGRASELLGEGSAVSPGDGLYLEIQSADAIHVYVIDEDDAGHIFVLHPLQGFEPGNPLPGGVRHRLPGTRAGSIENWQVTSAGGTEEITVIASRGPLTDLERGIAGLPHASRDARRAATAPAPSGVLRGIGETAPGAPRGEAGVATDVPGLLHGLADGSRRTHDTWVWVTRLRSLPEGR
jgi:hypothetical protein